VAAKANQAAVSFVAIGLPAIGPELRRAFALSLPELGAVLTGSLFGSWPRSPPRRRRGGSVRASSGDANRAGWSVFWLVTVGLALAGAGIAGTLAETHGTD
jgi:hypothetical protein